MAMNQLMCDGSCFGATWIKGTLRTITYRIGRGQYWITWRGPLPDFWHELDQQSMIRQSELLRRPCCSDTLSCYPTPSELIPAVSAKTEVKKQEAKSENNREEAKTGSNQLEAKTKTPKAQTHGQQQATKPQQQAKNTENDYLKKCIL